MNFVIYYNPATISGYLSAYILKKYIIANVRYQDINIYKYLIYIRSSDTKSNNICMIPYDYKDTSNITQLEHPQNAGYDIKIFFIDCFPDIYYEKERFHKLYDIYKKDLIIIAGRHPKTVKYLNDFEVESGHHLKISGLRSNNIGSVKLTFLYISEVENAEDSDIIIPYLVDMTDKFEINNVSKNIAYEAGNDLFFFYYRIKTLLESSDGVTTDSTLINILLDIKNIDSESTTLKSLLLEKITSEGSAIVNYVRNENKKLLDYFSKKVHVTLLIENTEFREIEEAYWVNDYSDDSYFLTNEPHNENRIYIIVRHNIYNNIKRVLFYKNSILPIGIDEGSSVNDIYPELSGYNDIYGYTTFAIEIDNSSSNSLIINCIKSGSTLIPDLRNINER